MKLGIVVGTTRQGRQSIRQAKWIAKAAEQLADTDVDLIDLADYDLPFFDEPISPRYNPNRDPHPVARQLMDKLAEKDAYIFVTPEYNHSIPGVLKNMFDYLDSQLIRKPAAIASHGTVGGARAAMHLKEIVNEGKALIIPSGVAVLMPDLADDNGDLPEATQQNPYGPAAALNSMLTELKWTSDALSAARAHDS